MFSLSHHAHIVVQVLRKPEKKRIMFDKRHVWGGGGCYGQLTLFRKQEKDVSFFHKGRIKIDTVVLSFLLRDKIAMVSHYSIVRG